MLVEFSVQNFRSISEKQTFSMVAGSASGKSDLLSIPTGNSLAPRLLRSACILGANGAGKSSFVKAANFVRSFVEGSASNANSEGVIEVEPFVFDDDWRQSPSEFELIFVHKESVYQYGFIVDEYRVYDEWLFQRPNDSGSRLRKIFTRSYQEENDKYSWYLNRSYIRGAKDAWRSSTRSNALFISTAVQLNSDDLSAPFEWITRSFRLVEDPSRLNDSYSAHKIAEGEWKEDILGLLRAADVVFDDISIELKDFDESDIPEDFPSIAAEQLKRSLRGKKLVSKIETFRTSSTGDLVPLTLDEESSGTKVLFSLSGPIIDTLRSGYTLFIDELHNNLHPLALRYIVDLFQSSETNKFGAQLIFTTHETSILEGCLHRDQIWLAEKNKSLQTTLRPVSDFKLRDISSFQKSYLDGRFGAVPIVGKLMHSKMPRSNG